MSTTCKYVLQLADINYNFPSYPPDNHIDQMTSTAGEGDFIIRWCHFVL